MTSCWRKSLLREHVEVRRPWLSPEKLVTIDVDHVRIGNRIFNPVQMGDLFEMLVKSVPRKFGYSAPPLAFRETPRGKPSDPITAATLYPRYRDFFKPKDLIVLESGSSNSGTFPLPLPDGAEVQTAPLWGSIGWATGAALGAALADPARRTILITGRRFAPVDRHRRRDHGTLWAQANHFCPQQRGLHGRAGARGGSELGLQRPRPLELSFSSRRPGLPGLVHGQGQHAR